MKPGIYEKPGFLKSPVAKKNQPPDGAPFVKRGKGEKSKGERRVLTQNKNQTTIRLTPELHENR